MIIKNQISNLVRVTQKKLSRYPIIYKLEINICLIISILLRKLRVPFRFFEDDLLLLKRIIQQSLDFKPKAEGKHIVFLSIRGWRVHLFFEVLLAARLRMDGHRVTFLSCFESIPLCTLGSINHSLEAQRNCQSCMNIKHSLWKEIFSVEYLPDAKAINDSIENLINQLDLSGCQTFEYDHAPYGDLVHRGLIWFLRRSRLMDTDLNIYRMMLVGAHTIRRGLEDFLSRNKVDSVVMINGDFPWEKVASWILRQKGIRFITHDYTFHEQLAIAVNQSVWDDLTFNKTDQLKHTHINNKDRKNAERILHLWRKNGGYQGQLFWTKNILKIEQKFKEKYCINGHPLAVAYTNMTFESSVTLKNRVFIDQFDWLTKLIDFFSYHQEFQLIIRIHPAEVRQSHWKPNESLYTFLKDEINTLPLNVKVIAPDEKISSYALGMMANAILVYSSTLGMEFADRNKCVITAAHVHYANHGFTIDPVSKNDYFESILNVLKGKYFLTKMHRQYLVDYVAWLFFHRLIPFEAISDIPEERPKINITNIKDLLSPQYPGIQKIAKLVIDGEQWW